MLQNIAENSKQLINSQYNDQDSLLCQLVKLKGRRRNFSFYEPTLKKGSIFQEPQFMPRMTFQSFRKGHRTYAPNQTFRKRTKSQEASKHQQKTFIKKSQELRRPYIQMLQLKNSSNGRKEQKIIHSFKNQELYGSSKTQKIHHERVFSRKDKFTKANQMVQEPGFMNLCFYRNTLEQIQSARTARFTSRKRNSPKRPEKEISNRNKIKFVKYQVNSTDHNPQCRPWSPKNESDLMMESGEFPYFKSVFVKG